MQDYEKLSKLNSRKSELKNLRYDWEALWQTIAAYLCPDRYRSTTTDSKGQQNREFIVDSGPSLALRICQSGMSTGIASPARPWFNFLSYDKDLSEDGEVKEFLTIATDMCRNILAGSNIYGIIHSMCSDLSAFGVAAGVIDEDEEDVVRGVCLVPGQYWLSCGPNGQVDTLCREFLMTVEQIVEKFVFVNGKGEPDWSVVSETVKSSWENGFRSQQFTVSHIIYPRLDHDPDKIGSENLPYASVYWLGGGSTSKDAFTGPFAGGISSDISSILQESGYHENPIIAPRWDVVGDDIYGRGPGVVALPDIKQLYAARIQYVNVGERNANGPVKVPTSYMNYDKSAFSAGGIIYCDEQPGNQIRPVFSPVDMSFWEALIANLSENIKRIFFNDLFFAISNMEGIQPRNTLEISERRDEKLLQLGPVINRVEKELLGVILNRTFGCAIRRGMIPPMPEKLVMTNKRHGRPPMTVEYISILAQAQRAVNTGAIDRLWAFAGNIAAAVPQVLDKMDPDQSIDEYAKMLGVTSAIVRPDDETADIREQRLAAEQQQQQMQAVEQMAPAINQGAQAAQVLSEVDQGGGAGELLSGLGLM